MTTINNDEHEMIINLKAIRIAYAFTVILLVVFCLYTWFSTGDMPTVPFIIVCTQALVLRIAKSLLGRKIKNR